jgi:hypothetical protein
LGEETKLVVVEHYPFAELRPLRLLGRTFLLQSADPDFAIDMLIALANTEPDEVNTRKREKRDR